MWARGSFAVPAAAEMMIPVRPWEARKQAREAPAGPAPTMRYGVSMRGVWLVPEGVEWLIGVVWGVVSTLQGCVVNNGQASGRAGFLAVRFFLGLTEGECESTTHRGIRTKTDGFLLQAGCSPESFSICQW